MRTADVAIATNSRKPLVAKAFIYGPFAIHRHVTQYDEVSSDPRASWTVTHVRTGLACAMWIRTKAAAFRLARMLVATRADWSFSSEAKIPKRTKDLGHVCVKRFRGKAA